MLITSCTSSAESALVLPHIHQVIMNHSCSTLAMNIGAFDNNWLSPLWVELETGME